MSCGWGTTIYALRTAIEKTIEKSGSSREGSCLYIARAVRGIREQADILEGSLDDLSDLQKKAEASSVAQLKRQAVDEISSMTGGQMQSFIGYQDTQWEDHYVGTYLQAAGLMRALYERGIRYSMDTFIENANALLDYQSLGTGPIQYYDMDEWFEYLSMEDTYIIDCDDVSVLGLTPFAN